jgi:putative FmdB family regulatory protein
VPTYQYACTECGHAFEQVQSFSDDALTVCPQCEGRLRKLFNAVGVVFKGSGFYRTDSRAKETSGASSSSDSSSSTASTSSTTSTTSTSGDSSSSSSAGSSSTKSPQPAAS